MIMGQIHSGTVHVSAKANHKFTFIVDMSSYKPNMITAETLFSDYGAIIVRENTILTPKMIKKLQDIGINKIRVYYNSSKLPLSESLKKFEERYIRNLHTLKGMIQDSLMGKTIDIKKVDNVAESIMEMDNGNSYVLKHVVLDNLDEYLYTHSINVGMLTMLIANWLKFDKIKTKLLVEAALLHDIGKCRVDSNILNKQGPLLQHEYSKIKEHVVNGLEILKDIPNINSAVCMGVIMHHEREDGSGYPRGLKGENIHEFAKIIAVADVFDAMTSNRIYRKKQSPFDVFEYMEQGNMAGLDVKVAMTFLENASNYYIGDTFFLNNGELCNIIFINPRQIARPLIKIGERYIDLAKDKELKITTVV